MNIQTIFIIAIIAFVFFHIMAKKKPPAPPAPPTPPPPPPPEPDPDKGTQEKIAIMILTGQTTPEGIQKEKNFDIEHIKKWVSDYASYAVNYSLDAHKINCRIDLMEDDIAWFKDVCRKYIGDNWEEVTDYHNRSRKKYK